MIFAQSTPALAVAQQASRSIPIVFAGVSDPVEQGFVSNLAHPGGNITGFANYEFSIAASHSHCAALPAGAMRPTSAQC